MKKKEKVDILTWWKKDGTKVYMYRKIGDLEWEKIPTPHQEIPCHFKFKQLVYYSKGGDTK